MTSFQQNKIILIWGCVHFLDSHIYTSKHTSKSVEISVFSLFIDSYSNIEGVLIFGKANMLVQKEEQMMLCNFRCALFVMGC